MNRRNLFRALSAVAVGICAAPLVAQEFVKKRGRIIADPFEVEFDVETVTIKIPKDQDEGYGIEDLYFYLRDQVPKRATGV